MSEQKDKHTRNVVKNMAGDIVSDFMSKNCIEIVGRTIGVIQGLPFIDRVKICFSIMRGKNEKQATYSSK